MATTIAAYWSQKLSFPFNSSSANKTKLFCFSLRFYETLYFELSKKIKLLLWFMSETTFLESHNDKPKHYFAKITTPKASVD